MMFGWTFNAVWQFIFSSASIATLIGIGASAVAILVPPVVAAIIPNLRWLAIYIALAAFSYSSIAGKFYHDGLAVKQAEWDRALDTETKQGDKAREDAERTVRADTPDRLRNDPRNRDNWKRSISK